MTLIAIKKLTMNNEINKPSQSKVPTSSVSSDAPQKIYNEEIDYEEDVVFGEKPNDDTITANFIENYALEYNEKVNGEYYNPRKHAHNITGAEQRGFYVYYAFPNGSKKPVASFWTISDDDRFRLVHINIGKVMEQIIKYYENRGYFVPPKREGVKQVNN